MNGAQKNTSQGNSGLHRSSWSTLQYFYADKYISKTVDNTWASLQKTLDMKSCGCTDNSRVWRVHSHSKNKRFTINIWYPDRTTDDVLCRIHSARSDKHWTETIKCEPTNYRRRPCWTIISVVQWFPQADSTHQHKSCTAGIRWMPTAGDADIKTLVKHSEHVLDLQPDAESSN